MNELGPSILLALGCALLIVGFALVWSPLGLIVAGTVIIVAVVGYVRGREQHEQLEETEL